jgi:hypothetical protein
MEPPSCWTLYIACTNVKIKGLVEENKDFDDLQHNTWRPRGDEYNIEAPLPITPHTHLTGYLVIMTAHSCNYFRKFVSAVGLFVDVLHYDTARPVSHFKWLLYVPLCLTFNNYTFCQHSVFMCFVWISEQTAIISLYNIN